VTCPAVVRGSAAAGTSHESAGSRAGGGGGAPAGAPAAARVAGILFSGVRRATA
jgi:hypothetical protein